MNSASASVGTILRPQHLAYGPRSRSRWGFGIPLAALLIALSCAEVAHAQSGAGQAVPIGDRCFGRACRMLSLFLSSTTPLDTTVLSIPSRRYLSFNGGAIGTLPTNGLFFDGTNFVFRNGGNAFLYLDGGGTPNVSSGSPLRIRALSATNGIEFTVSGARLDLGTAVDDYWESDGTGTSTPGYINSRTGFRNLDASEGVAVHDPEGLHFIDQTTGALFRTTAPDAVITATNPAFLFRATLDYTANDAVLGAMNATGTMLAKVDSEGDVTANSFATNAGQVVIYAAGQVSIGGGSSIAFSTMQQITQDNASLAVQTCRVEATQATTGVVAGRPCEVGVSIAQPTGSVFTCYTIAGSVVLKQCCIGAEACDIASATYEFRTF